MRGGDEENGAASRKPAVEAVMQNAVLSAHRARSSGSGLAPVMMCNCFSGFAGRVGYNGHLELRTMRPTVAS